MTKKKKLKITKGEKLLYVGAVFAFFGTLLIQVFCGASIGHLNMNVEMLKYNIDSQEKKNESLVMQVNELTAFDKVKDVVANMGLAYNNENIIVVDK